jgi:hypothetical protein
MDTSTKTAAALPFARIGPAAAIGASLEVVRDGSFFPFVTGWIGENHNAPLPTALMGLVLLASAVAYYILQQIRHQGSHSRLATAIGRGLKGRISPLFALGVPLAFVHPAIADSLYVLVALIWLAPDPRIERGLKRPSASQQTPIRSRSERCPGSLRPDRC